METTVTGVFADAADAHKVIDQLAAAGFRREDVTVVTGDTPDRHELIGEETSDASRGMLVGVIVCGVGAAIAAFCVCAAFTEFGVNPWVAGLGGAICGTAAGGLVGWLIGSGTGHQVQEQYESLLDSGYCLLAVNTDRVRSTQARELLAAAGGTSLSISVHRKHHGAVQQSA